MGEVVSEIRALQVFETFARLKRPLRLSELAAEMDVPVSSCFALVRRLLAEGHLFEPVDKRGYYPTGKLKAWTTVIALHDPIAQRIQPLLEALRDGTGETITLGRLSGDAVLYIAAVESLNSIRMAGRVGIARPVHAVAAGKALLSALAPRERAAMLRNHVFEKLTPRSRGSLDELERDILEGQALGCYISREESIEGAMAVAAPLTISGQGYAIQVAGPVARMSDRLGLIIAALAQAVSTLDEPGRLVNPGGR